MQLECVMLLIERVSSHEDAQLADSGVSALSPHSLKTAAHLPDLLPASAMMR